MATPPTEKERLFNAAAELSDPAQRAAFLDSACGEDAALRAELEGSAPPRRGGGQLPPYAGPGLAEGPTARPGHWRHCRGCGRPGGHAGRQRPGRHHRVSWHGGRSP